MTLDYMSYNREERDICSHLFRLLLDDQSSWEPLCEFIGTDSVTIPRIFTEVALIRDAYYARKPNTDDFVKSLCDAIACLNGVNTYTQFCDLPDWARDPNQTHPKQIKHKLQEAGKLRVDDKTVYGSLQAVFNAKPDLAICTGNTLLIYEAKYTLAFDQTQLERTEQIGAIWSELLFRDLGFDTPPRVVVRKLGLQRYNPDVSWEQVHKIALAHWGESDFSTIVFSKVLSVA